MTLPSAALVITLLACGGTEAPEATPTPAVNNNSTARKPIPRPAGTMPGPAAADVGKVVKALTTKTPEPRCGDVDTLVLDPPSVYRHIVAQNPEPPYVRVRAATCLLTGHPREAQPDAIRWVTDPNDKSLTLVVMGRLDTMPADVGVAIAQAGLNGPHADLVKGRLSKSRTPELKALAE